MWTPIYSERLHVIRFPELVTGEAVAELLRAVATGSAERGFDVLTDYSAVQRVAISMDELVRLAMARRAALPETGREIQSAAICCGEEARDFVETWSAFFEEEHRAIRTRIFSGVDPALAWLGRAGSRDAITGALTRLSAE